MPREINGATYTRSADSLLLLTHTWYGMVGLTSKWRRIQSVTVVSLVEGNLNIQCANRLNLLYGLDFVISVESEERLRRRMELY